MTSFKLLIVDDEPAILNGLRHMIEEAHTVFNDIAATVDSCEALGLVTRFAPDLVITDIQMPEIDGLEFIRQAQDLVTTRFVILTGYDHFEYARQALRLHVRDFLLKPIQYNELIEVLNRNALELLEERRNDDSSTNTRADQETESAIIRRYKAYVRDHFMYDISLSDVADHLELHPNYVCNLVKRGTGATFVQYLRSVRIEKAKAILSHPDRLTIEQVARSVGYRNARTFYKVFKEVTGVTPGDMRDVGDTT